MSDRKRTLFWRAMARAAQAECYRFARSYVAAVKS